METRRTYPVHDSSRVHSAAVTLDGKLFTWGHGRGGRLGHGNEDVCMLPTLVQGLANQAVVDVAASETHTAALTADGELYTWGRGRFGQVYYCNTRGLDCSWPTNC